MKTRNIVAALLALSLALIPAIAMATDPPAPAAPGQATRQETEQATEQAKAKAPARGQQRQVKPRRQQPQAVPLAGTDRSGKTRRGKASYYSRRFRNKTMANGQPFKPDSNAAASKTLPIGTVARVTNQETGKSADVVVKDRGPYVDGRIIDVTPKTAEQLEMKKEGVAPVKVTPLELPGKTGDAGTGKAAPAPAPTPTPPTPPTPP